MQKFTVNSFIFLCLVVSTPFISATYYEDCGSQDKVISFDISDCDVPPCIVVRPGMYDVNITFVSGYDAETIDTSILALVGNEEYPWPAPDGCTHMVGASCPIQKDQTYFFSATMPVFKEYPAITVLVTWMLTDENGILHVCTKVPVTLV